MTHCEGEEHTLLSLSFSGKDTTIKILAVDQARHGAWSVFDYETKELVAYDSYDFSNVDFTYAAMIMAVVDLVDEVVREFDVSAIFIEDIQLRRNVDSFKKLAMLQGALVSNFERNSYLYDYVYPSTWQNYCKARGRKTKEIDKKITTAQTDDGKAPSKQLSIEFVRNNFGVETENDNIADAICIGHYVVNNVTIEEQKENN